MWDLPGPGLEPVSPALAGGFLTTAPPGKPSQAFLESASCINHAHRSPHLRPHFQGSPHGTLAPLGVTAPVSLPLFEKDVQGKAVALQLLFKTFV